MAKIRCLLVFVFISVGCFCAARTNWLAEKCGPKLYSQDNEELIIRDFFSDRRGGRFVDIGAGHWMKLSNTCYLEKHLDWSGIAVDAICDYKKGYLLHRKNTKFHCFFVTDKSDQEMDFYTTFFAKRTSSGNLDFAKKHGLYSKAKVRSITLNDLLEREGISQFDFLSISKTNL